MQDAAVFDFLSSVVHNVYRRHLPDIFFLTRAFLRPPVLANVLGFIRTEDVTSCMRTCVRYKDSKVRFVPTLVLSY